MWTPVLSKRGRNHATLAAADRVRQEDQGQHSFSLSRWESAGERDSSLTLDAFSLWIDQDVELC